LRAIFREAKSERIIERNAPKQAELMARQGRKRDIFSIPEPCLLYPTTWQKFVQAWGPPKYDKHGRHPPHSGALPDLQSTVVGRRACHALSSDGKNT
jgi:hypothetical protein